MPVGPDNIWWHIMRLTQGKLIHKHNMNVQNMVRLQLRSWLETSKLTVVHLTLTISSSWRHDEQHQHWLFMIFDMRMWNHSATRYHNIYRNSSCSFRIILYESPSINCQLNLFYTRATVATQSTFYLHPAIHTTHQRREFRTQPTQTHGPPKPIGLRVGFGWAQDFMGGPGWADKSWQKHDCR